MNKRKMTSVIVLALVISVATSLQVVDLVSANYFPPPSIEVPSPISSPKIYQDASVPLQVTVNVLTTEPDITYIRYSLDGKGNITLTSLTKKEGVSYWTTTKGVFIQGTAFRAEASLDNLAEGKHTLTVYSHDAAGKEMSESREFTVDYDYVPPQSPFAGYTNQTAMPTPTTTQTETPMPTINTGSLQPLENPVPFIIIACVAASLLATALYFRKKSQRNGIG